MSTEPDKKAAFPVGKALNLNELIQYGDGAVVSRTIVKNEAGTVTLFAFDADQGLSEHAAPFDALVQVIDGRGEFVIGGTPNRVAAGEVIMMPANIPHSVKAYERFKMVLTMLRK
jgi:quercetin dioxygenase-like cupin family protein